MSTHDEQYSFIAEWYDPHAAIIRKYQLSFYPHDNTLGMYDIKNRRIFLQRSKNECIREKNLYIGCTFNLNSRQLKLTEYGDEYTKRKLGSKKERTLGLIKPDAVAKMGPILELISQAGFSISKLKMCSLSRNEAMDFYKEHQSQSFFNALIGFITSGPVIAMELMSTDAILKWRDLLGPTDSAQARSDAPTGIRARFGTDNTKNACHGSDSMESAARELEFFFPSCGEGRQGTAKLVNCTCCIIKPHAVKEGLAGNIINCIQEAGFQISTIQMFHMEKANAEEFYEVYKGVVQEYGSMVEELTAGTCIAMEICAADAPTQFREFVGPADPEMARHLRPRSLRAKFGIDKIKNAVHCTDLPEDGQLEVEYFFNILSH